MDLRDGFDNILVKPADRHKTAFKTRYGLFEYRVLPFGLCNTPGTLVRMMNRIFGIFMKMVIEFILCWDPKHQKCKSKPGLFGFTKGYRAATETQNSGNLHAHFITWIHGLPETGKEFA
jgi:hypothetical protein